MGIPIVFGALIVAIIVGVIVAIILNRKNKGVIK